jgi:hypothetical protein
MRIMTETENKDGNKTFMGYVKKIDVEPFNIAGKATERFVIMLENADKDRLYVSGLGDVPQVLKDNLDKDVQVVLDYVRVFKNNKVFSNIVPDSAKLAALEFAEAKAPVAVKEEPRLGEITSADEQRVTEHYVSCLKKSREMVMSESDTYSPALHAAVFEKIASPLIYLQDRWRSQDAAKRLAEKRAEQQSK